MRFLDMMSGAYKPVGYKTRTILVLNSKGGSGKTTVATNLASYFAIEDVPVALVDFDPQGSSMAWLAQRDADHAPIFGLAGWREPLWVPQHIDTVIFDVAAGVRDRRLVRMLRRAQTVIVPVLPSPFDIRAAEDFIFDLTSAHRRANLDSKIAVLANRIRESSRAYGELDEFLSNTRLPFVASLRESLNYLSAAERGLGIFEMKSASVTTDKEQWRPLLRWLKSKRSRPAHG